MFAAIHGLQDTNNRGVRLNFTAVCLGGSPGTVRGNSPMSHLAMPRDVTRVSKFFHGLRILTRIRRKSYSACRGEPRYAVPCHEGELHGEQLRLQGRNGPKKGRYCKVRYFKHGLVGNFSHRWVITLWRAFALLLRPA